MESENRRESGPAPNPFPHGVEASNAQTQEPSGQLQVVVVLGQGARVHVAESSSSTNALHTAPFV